MSLSQALTELRKKHGLSQMELAEEMGVSTQSVSKWEVGDAIPATKNLIYLSKRYGVSMDYLVHGGELPPMEPAPPVAPQVEPSVEPTAEPTAPRKKNWKVFAAVGAAVCLLVVVILTYTGNTKSDLPIEAMKEEQIGTVSDSGFDFG